MHSDIFRKLCGVIIYISNLNAKEAESKKTHTLKSNEREEKRMCDFFN